MITIKIETQDGTFIAKTNNPEIAEMELDSLVREYFTCEDCALEYDCEKECKLEEQSDIEERREHQRNVINKYIENK